MIACQKMTDERVNDLDQELFSELTESLVQPLLVNMVPPFVAGKDENYTVFKSTGMFCGDGGFWRGIGSLSNDNGNGNGNENVTRKYIFISFVLLRDYFNSLNFYKNDELFRNQIGRSGVQVKKENEKFTVVRSSSPQNLKNGHFTLLFCRGRQRNVPKCKTHVQSDCFCSLFCGVVVAVAVVVA